MPIKFTDEALHRQAIAEAKRKFKIWPSAYGSGWATRRYRELYKAKNKRSAGAFTGKSDSRSDSLKTWFNEDWKAINSSGTIVGECGSGNTKGKVKCLPASKARSLSKKDRSRLAKRKQSQDPKAGRSGAPVMVSSKLDSIDLPRDLRWDSAIDRIEQKYGLRLDSWRRLGPNQRGKPCGRGWVGLRGACKRGKKSDDNTEKIKASKVELADKIRAKKGMRDRNAAKPVVEEKRPDRFIPHEMVYSGGRRGSKPWVAHIPGTIDEKYGLTREFVDADKINFKRNGNVEKAAFSLKKPGIYVDSEGDHFLVKADPKTGQLRGGGIISRNEVYHTVKNDPNRLKELTDPFHEDNQQSASLLGRAE